MIPSPSSMPFPDTGLAAGGRTEAGAMRCFPQPDPAVLAFSSATSSPVSHAGFAAADRLRRRLLLTNSGQPSATIHARELERIRQELIHAAALENLDDPDVIFAASETALHMIAIQLTCGAAVAPPRVIVIGAEESEGAAAICAGGRFDVVSVPMRHGDGTLREPSVIDGDTGSLVNEAIAMRRQVLLVLADVSGTGIAVHGLDCATAVRDRFPESVHVLVDASQFRLAFPTLHTFLERGFMVALGGSRFFTAPAFAGALLLPSQVHRRLRRRPLPPSLAQYSTRADWPADWPGIDMLADVADLGQLMCWEAALEEMRALRRIPDVDLVCVLYDIGEAIRTRLRDDPHFEPLPVQPPGRGDDTGVACWDRMPTIFPFLLREPSGTSGRRPLGMDETARIHALLQTNLVEEHGLNFVNGNREIAMLRCQLGEPVPCGMRAGMPVSALRLCLSARMVVEGARGNSQDVIDKALATLDKTALLVRVFLYGSMF